MTLVRLAPWSQVASLQGDMARLMNQFFGTTTPVNGGQGDAATWLPPVDVTETENDIVLAFDLPGLRQEDISVELDDNVLTVSGQRERKSEESKDNFYRYERRFGAFSRSVSLPAGVVENDIQASYDNGVLEVRVPKPEEQKPKRIQIGAGASTATIEGEGTRQT